MLFAFLCIGNALFGQEILTDMDYPAYTFTDTPVLDFSNPMPLAISSNYKDHISITAGFVDETPEESGTDLINAPFFQVEINPDLALDYRIELLLPEPVEVPNTQGQCTLGIYGNNTGEDLNCIIQGTQSGEITEQNMGKLNFMGWTSLTAYLENGTLPPEDDSIRILGFALYLDPLEINGQPYSLYFSNANVRTMDQVDE